MDEVEKRKRCYSIIEKEFVKIFIYAEKGQEYQVINFLGVIAELEKSMRDNNLEWRREKPFCDCIYYLNELFNGSYLISRISNIVYDDEAQICYTTYEQKDHYGTIKDVILEEPYSEIENIEISKKLREGVLKINEISKSSWFVVEAKTVTLPKDRFKNYALILKLKDMAEQLQHISYYPPKSFLSYKNELMDRYELGFIDVDTKSNGKPRQKIDVSPTVDLADKWLLVSDKKEFIERNKPYIQGKKGKELYSYVVAMQMNGQLKQINEGEVSNLFYFLSEFFGAIGSRENLNRIHHVYRANEKTYYSIKAINEIGQKLK